MADLVAFLTSRLLSTVDTSRHHELARIQNENLNVRVIPAKAGIQSTRTGGQVWMPAFAGMTLTF